MAAKAEGGGRTAEVAEGEVAEGFELVTSHSSGTGFKGVTKLSGRKARPYEARIWENGSMRHLGIFATAKEAALCYARHVGPERAAAEAAEANVPVPQPLTAEEARAAAVAEGLEFIPSGSMSGTGFRATRQAGGADHPDRACAQEAEAAALRVQGAHDPRRRGLDPGKRARRGRQGAHVSAERV